MKCTKCHREFPDEAFYPSGVNRHNRRRHCPACFRDARIKRVYGVTPELLNRMLEAQGGGCAVCGSRENLCIDHDHRTLRIRGVLCRACNTAAGLLGDSVDRMGLLIQYLQRPTRYGEIPSQTRRLTGAALVAASTDMVTGYRAGASLKQLMELHRLSYHAVRNRLLKSGITLRAKGGQWRNS